MRERRPHVAGPEPKLIGIFFVCAGCGRPACVFPYGLPGKVFPGTVGHSLPQCNLFVKNTCAYYVRSNSSSRRIPPPSTFDWFGQLLDGVTIVQGENF